MRESREKDDSIETDLNLGTALLLFWTRISKEGEVKEVASLKKQERKF